MSKTAIIIGATGLVGSHLLKLLIEDKQYANVILITRKLVIDSSEKIVQHVINFDHLKDHKDKLKGQDVFCCLGTTMKKAGSKEAFRKVDFEYVLSFAQITAQNNSESFHLISSMGADKSSLFFYNKVKGDIEEAITNVGFKNVRIFRPSLILGNRSDSRPAEKLAQLTGKAFSFIFAGPLKRFKPIKALTIAKAMLRSTSSGIKIYESDEIATLGQ